MPLNFFLASHFAERSRCVLARFEVVAIYFQRAQYYSASHYKTHIFKILDRTI